MDQAWNSIRRLAGRRGFALLPLCLLILLVYSQVGITHQDDWMSNPDLVEQVYPWMELQASAFARGELPLWNPYQWGGQPLLGQVQPGSAYPLNWILFALPERDGLIGYRFLDWYFVLLHCFAGAAAYALCRGLGSTRMGAVIGGLIFSLGGYIGRVDWPQMLNGAAWAPLVFLAVLRGPDWDRPRTAAALGGVALGMSWLAGHHQVPLFVSLTVLALWLWRIGEGGKVHWPRIVDATLFFGIAGLSSALQVLPGWEYGRHAARWAGAAVPLTWDETVPYTVHAALSSRPHRLLGIIFPNIVDQYDHYLGFVGLTLAVVGVIAWWGTQKGLKPQRAVYVRLLVVIAIGSLVLAMGAATGFHRMLYALLPMVNKARTPAAFSAIFSVAAAALAALGFDALRGRLAMPEVRIAARVLGVAGFTLFLGSTFLFYANGTIFPFEDRFVLSGFVGLLLAAMLAAWVRSEGSPERCSSSETSQTEPSQTEATGHSIFSPRFLSAGVLVLLLVELSMSTLEPMVPKAGDTRRSAYRERRAHGDVAAFIRRQSLGTRAELQGDGLGGSLGDIYQVPVFSGSTASVPEALWDLRLATPRNLQLYGVRFFIGRERPPDSLTNGISPDAVATFEDGLKAWELPGALPRAWITHHAEGVSTMEDFRERLNQPDRDLQASAIFLGDAPLLSDCSPKPSKERATITDYGLNHVALLASTNCAALLVLSENYFPGWEATVDGTPAELLQPFHSLRGVLLPAGEHRVEMRYSPWSVPVGAILTALGWIFACAVTIWERRRKVVR